MAINWGGAASGAVGGGTMGSSFGPWGTAIGGIAGGLAGLLSPGQESTPGGYDTIYPMQLPDYASYTNLRNEGDAFWADQFKGYNGGFSDGMGGVSYESPWVSKYGQQTQDAYNQQLSDAYLGNGGFEGPGIYDQVSRFSAMGGLGPKALVANMGKATADYSSKALEIAKTIAQQKMDLNKAILQTGSSYTASVPQGPRFMMPGVVPFEGQQGNGGLGDVLAQYGGSIGDALGQIDFSALTKKVDNKDYNPYTQAGYGNWAGQSTQENAYNRGYNSDDSGPYGNYTNPPTSSQIERQRLYSGNYGILPSSGFSRIGNVLPAPTRW